MSKPPAATSIRWYRTFYFRIAFSFVVVVVTVLVAQSVIFSVLLARPPLRGRAPNNIAAIVAADLESTLAQDPAADIAAYLNREYARLQPVYVVMKSGAMVANRTAPLPENLRRLVDDVLAGADFKRPGPRARLGGRAVVMAPIQVAGELRGMVVLPPATPPSPVARDLGRLFSLPGTALLVVATVIAAVFIFEPARRRLRALQDAARRLGAGDLTARAPDSGRDEIADVAATFNKMAAELGARDEALRTSDRLRRQMLADVSHELKTPLTAMRGYVETLRMADLNLDASTRERYFATLERETSRLDRIVRDLTDLARLDNGVGELDVRVFAVGRLFEHVAARNEHTARAKRVTIRVDVGDAADQMVGDPDRIEQVVDNLVANALRYTDEGGGILLSARVEGGTTILSVADSGAGIPPEHLGHVFERFYKVDAARANGPAGSGLGLSIAKAIVERHGGTIDVSSEPGCTVFTLRLPQDHAGAAAGRA
jgi:signal transduction histidine kinase